MIEPGQIKPSRIRTIFDLDPADQEVIREVHRKFPYDGKDLTIAGQKFRVREPFPRLKTLDSLSFGLEVVLSVLVIGLAVGFVLGALIL